MKRILSTILLFSTLCPLLFAADKPNILFIAIDDQNDWIGHLGGHPMAKTPNLDKLAARGTTFLNAHCNAPLCNPSRTSLMLGLRPDHHRHLRTRAVVPHAAGVEGPRGAAAALCRPTATAPRPRARSTTAARAVVAAAKARPQRIREATPEFQVTAPYGGVGTKPPKKLIPPTPMGNNPLMDWGVWPLDNDDTGKGDYQVASWTVEQIKYAPKDQPFFIAAGFFLPHVPVLRHAEVVRPLSR